MHERLDFLQGEAAIFISVHCPEDSLVSRLKLLQGDGPVTITVHQSEKHPRHHAGTHTPSYLLGPSCRDPIIPPRPIMPGPIVPPRQSWCSCCCGICGGCCIIGPCWALAAIAPHARMKVDVVSTRTCFCILNLLRNT